MPWWYENGSYDESLVLLNPIEMLIVNRSLKLVVCSHSMSSIAQHLLDESRQHIAAL